MIDSLSQVLVSFSGFFLFVIEIENLKQNIKIDILITKRFHNIYNEQIQFTNHFDRFIIKAF